MGTKKPAVKPAMKKKSCETPKPSGLSPTETIVLPDGPLERQEEEINQLSQLVLIAETTQQLGPEWRFAHDHCLIRARALISTGDNTTLHAVPDLPKEPGSEVGPPGAFGNPPDLE